MRARIVVPCSLMLLVILLTDVAARQDNVSPGMPVKDAGDASISGRVMLPSGWMNSSHLKIVLSNSQAPMTTLYSNKNGEFGFNNLRAGTYYIQVFADESLYEPLIQRVKLNPSEPANLVLYLKEKTTRTAPTSRGNLISTAEAEQAIPVAARKAFDAAHKLIEKGDIDGAIVELNKALSLYPDYLNARNNLGVQYLKRKRWEEAAEQFKTILEKHPKYFNARLNLGIVLVEQKRFREAIDELNQAIALDSSQAAAHLLLGIAALDVDDLEVAERELVKALLLGGEVYSNAHYYFAHVYMKTGRREEAARELALFLKTAPAGEMATQARALLEQLSRKP